jgi:hypothetical protein
MGCVLCLAQCCGAAAAGGHRTTPLHDEVHARCMRGACEVHAALCAAWCAWTSIQLLNLAFQMPAAVATHALLPYGKLFISVNMIRLI